MAHVFERERSSGVQEAWQARTLHEGEVRTLGEAAVALLCDRDAFVLAARPGAVRVNGEAVHAGLRRLRDRDEIRLQDGETYWFATATPAHVQPFPESLGTMRCVRSRCRLHAGTPSVCCPNCGAWYAQHDRVPAWTYGASCVVCGLPTELSGAFPWQPGDFEQTGEGDED